MGRVKGLKRNKILTGSCINGYLLVNLCRGGYFTGKYIHRLVLEAFCPHPDSNILQVNHINEVRGDNRLENLEWCTSKYNNNYGNRNKKVSESHKKYVGMDNRQVKRKYYEDHSERLKAYHKDYYEKHKDKLKQVFKDYYQTNKEKVKQRARNYYHKKKEDGLD